MDSRIILSALMGSLALAGCGGSSGSSSSSGYIGPTYTWQIINLYEADLDDVDDSCAIFNLQEGETDKVIAANLASVGYKILYHNADGSVITDETIEDSDLPDDGEVTIDAGLVPDGGYVSVEEYAGSNTSNQDVYLFTVQDSLLRDLTINIQYSQINADCYEGEQFTGYTAYDGASVSVEDTSSAYYQSSYVDSAVDGQTSSSHVPVLAPIDGDLPVLITAFSDYTSELPNLLTHFSMVPATEIYDVNDSSSSPSLAWMTEVSDTPSLSITGIDVDSSSQVALAYGDELYQWQPIDSTTTQLAYEGDNLSDTTWAIELLGTTTTGQWQLTYQAPFSADDVAIEAPDVTTFSATLDSSCGATYCVTSSGFTSSDYQIQRTQVRGLSTSNSRDFYQTIFAEPSSSQVLMSSSSQDLSYDSTTPMEISLGQISTSSADEVKAFLEHSVDIQSAVVDEGLNDFEDWNGVVSLYSTEKAREIRNMSDTLIRVENQAN